jgi:TRAP-type C4-dicarboxylate transport system permease small subunit
MYGATWTGIILLLIICFLPALAVLLSAFASILTFFSRTRIFSLILAFLCLLIYGVFATSISSQQFSQELDTLPLGRFFHSMIPLAGVMAVAIFDICALSRRKRKNDAAA